MTTDTLEAARQNGGSSSALSSNIPQKRIVSIEHPCIIKNFSNALKSLGGEHQLKHVLEHKIGDGKRSGSEPTAILSLRPDDPLAKRLASTAAPTQNVLVKVTVPKRTGRKRKRGSDEPFTDDAARLRRSDSITAPELLERLRDTSGKYTIQAIGTIENTHRFQTLPDLQMRADELPIMREIRDRAMTSDYVKLQDFRMDSRSSEEETSTFPGPPQFITAKQPYPNPGKKAETPTPLHSISKKPQAKKKNIDIPGGETGITLMESPNIPQGPASTLKPPSASLKTTITALKNLMQTRPILTHRVADALLPTHSFRAINQAVPYAGYYVHKGPWEGCIIRHGLDPRCDPGYRIYQTLQFNFSGARELNKSLDPAAPNTPRHIFDGHTLTEAAKYWQLTDLSDPVLALLVHTSTFRRPGAGDCDALRFGWYFNGTIAKIRTIMRDKMVAIVNREPLLKEAEYAVLASLPERVEDEAVCVVGESWGVDVARMAGQIGKEALKGPFRTDRMLRRPTAGARVEGRRLAGGNGKVAGGDVDGVSSGDGEDAPSPTETGEDGRSPEANGIEEFDEDVNDEDSDEDQSDEDDADDDSETG